MGTCCCRRHAKINGIIVTIVDYVIGITLITCGTILEISYQKGNFSGSAVYRLFACLLIIGGILYIVFATILLVGIRKNGEGIIESWIVFSIGALSIQIVVNIFIFLFRRHLKRANTFILCNIPGIFISMVLISVIWLLLSEVKAINASRERRFRRTVAVAV